jgi:hypothetical protein
MFARWVRTSCTSVLQGRDVRSTLRTPCTVHTKERAQAIAQARPRWYRPSPARAPARVGVGGYGRSYVIPDRNVHSYTGRGSKGRTGYDNEEARRTAQARGPRPEQAQSAGRDGRRRQRTSTASGGTACTTTRRRRTTSSRPRRATVPSFHRSASNGSNSARASLTHSVSIGDRETKLWRA